MKRILLLLAAAAVIGTPVVSHARAVLIAENQAQGRIVLTDLPGTCGSGWRTMFNTDSGGNVRNTGCWTVAPDDDSFFHVRYAGEHSDRLYPAEMFVMTPEGIAKYGN